MPPLTCYRYIAYRFEQLCSTETALSLCIIKELCFLTLCIYLLCRFCDTASAWNWWRQLYGSQRCRRRASIWRRTYIVCQKSR